MLKAYRKRFVLSNLLLVGIVLLAALVVQGVYHYRSSYAELMTTMRLILEPWDTPGERFRSLGEAEQERTAAPPSPRPEDSGGTPPRPGTEPSGGRRGEEGIVTVFYNGETGEISLMSREIPLDTEVIAAAVPVLAALPEASGKLAADSLYYYREGDADGCKLALASTRYLGEKVLRNSLLLLGAYLVSMGLVFLISLRLSRLAARPMEDALSMERQFVANISHDLKTPITVILANNSILRTSPEAGPEERLPWLDSTEEAAGSMLGLVNEMLSLAALEETGRRVELTAVDLSSAAEKAVLQLESLAWERGVTLETEIPEAVTVRGTEDYAQRICSGLTENAIKYEPVGGRVRVTLSQVRKKAVLTVENRGSFIPPEDLPHIFERFYRGDKARSGRKGYGLGLPILRQLTELVGASMAVRSDEKSGTVFTVTFDTIN